MSSRGRIKLNRRRFDIRKYLNIRNGLIVVACVILFTGVSTVITGNILKKKVQNSTVKFKENANFNLDDSTYAKSDNINENDIVDENNKNEIDDSDDNLQAAFNNIDNTSTPDSTLNKVDDGNININFLGELMFGGEVTNNLNYLYNTAIKDVYSIVRSSDFTYANFSTNITNLEKIENAKSKYLVTSDILSTLTALGLDCVSIASDHIVDFPEEIIKNTINKLEEDEIFVAGREDMPVYFEKGDKKIAIVSTNAVIIGTAKNYTNYGISVYSEANLKKNIKEAKESADVVIADIHWGRDHTYGLTDQMRKIATVAIDSGADMVIGSHALGVYPIVKYKDKPIIYSTGYFMSDFDYNVAKEGFIFNLNISKESKITSLEMIPIYIEDKKVVRLYNEYDSNKCMNFLNQFNNWHIENSLNSRVEDNKIIVEF